MAALPGESTAALRERVQAVALSSSSSDPIETAKRALRAQRERRAQRSEPRIDDLRRRA
jgi:hypothetical protein